MNAFFRYKRSTVFCLTMLLMLAIAPYGGIALAIDAHPPQLVGRWVTEFTPSVTIVFQEEGSLKRLRGDEPVAEYGYWEQPEQGRLRIKWFEKEPRLVSYTIDGDVLRITADKGDTLVHRRVRADKPIEIVGEWFIENPRPADKPVLVFHEDGTYEVIRLSPNQASEFPGLGRGIWKWLENDWIAFTSPDIKGESRWQVKRKDGELKFISARGEIIVFTKSKALAPEQSPQTGSSPATRKPATLPSSGDQLANLAAMRQVRAQQLEEETAVRIREAKSMMASDSLGAKKFLTMCRADVEKSSDLDGATRQRLLDELDAQIREAVVQSYGNKVR